MLNVRSFYHVCSGKQYWFNLNICLRTSRLKWHSWATIQILAIGSDLRLLILPSSKYFHELKTFSGLINAKCKKNNISMKLIFTICWAYSTPCLTCHWHKNIMPSDVLSGGKMKAHQVVVFRTTALDGNTDVFSQLSKQ